MADNGRWWKLWVTAPYDPDLGSLSLEDFARWCLFGVYMKVHGNDGTVHLTSPATPVLNLLRLKTFDQLLITLRMFPNCRVTCVTTGTVTYEIEMCNWRKYQGDFSGDRVRKHRAKSAPHVTDQEEKRGEEKRGEERSTKTLATVVDKSTPWPTMIDDVRTFLVSIEAPEIFFNQTYWLRIDQWLGGNDSAVYYFDELKAYLAWIAAQNGHRKHKDMLRGFRNWLSTCSRWKERDAQRKAAITPREKVYQRF